MAEKSEGTSGAASKTADQRVHFLENCLKELSQSQRRELLNWNWLNVNFGASMRLHAEEQREENE